MIPTEDYQRIVLGALCSLKAAMGACAAPLPEVLVIELHVEQAYDEIAKLRADLERGGLL